MNKYEERLNSYSNVNYYIKIYFEKVGGKIK